MDSVRFWAKVNKDGPIAPGMDTPCWLWTAFLNHDDYGRIKTGGKSRLVYHITWEQENGPVPDGLELDHLCRVRACCRPSHLEAVTHFVQMSRAQVERNANAEKTRCPAGHPYDEANTYQRPDRVGRICRKCRTANTTKRRRKERTP